MSIKHPYSTIAPETAQHHVDAWSVAPGGLEVPTHTIHSGDVPRVIALGVRHPDALSSGDLVAPRRIILARAMASGAIADVLGVWDVKRADTTGADLILKGIVLGKSNGVASEGSYTNLRPNEILYIPMKPGQLLKIVAGDASAVRTNWGLPELTDRQRNEYNLARRIHDVLGPVSRQ